MGDKRILDVMFEKERLSIMILANGALIKRHVQLFYSLEFSKLLSSDVPYQFQLLWNEKSKLLTLISNFWLTGMLMLLFHSCVLVMNVKKKSSFPAIKFHLFLKEDLSTILKFFKNANNELGTDGVRSKLSFTFGVFGFQNFFWM